MATQTSTTTSRSASKPASSKTSEQQSTKQSDAPLQEDLMVEMYLKDNRPLAERVKNPFGSSVS